MDGRGCTEDPVSTVFSSQPSKQALEEQIKARSEFLPWVAAQITHVVAEHRARPQKILESDLLRTAGALSHLGLQLSAYLGSGYDCVNSTFQFDGLPTYECPVEIKKRSQGFTYQVREYTNLPRAVVLCMDHDFVNPPDHIDVIELPTLAEYLGNP